MTTYVIDVSVTLHVETENDASATHICQALDDADYSFKLNDAKDIKIVGTEITDYEVTDW